MNARRLGWLVARLKADVVPSNRTVEYAGLLRQALDAGYAISNLRDFNAAREGIDSGSAQLRLVLRHDVDITNVAGNELFFAVEQAAGVTSTFYFRRSTVASHRGLIRRLRDTGNEVGYHFEEGATLAKELRLRRREDVLAHRGDIVERFLANCAQFRRDWNPELVSVSSHGDWVNTRLGFINNEFVDRDVLQAAQLSFEAYDTRLMESVECYISDVAERPGLWANGLNLSDAVTRRMSPIYMLTHERNWHTNPVANLRQDVVRSIESVKFAVSR